MNYNVKLAEDAWFKIQHHTKHFKKKTSSTVTKTYKNIKSHQEQKCITE